MNQQPTNQSTNEPINQPLNKTKINQSTNTRARWFIPTLAILPLLSLRLCGNDDDDRWALFLDRPLLMMFNNQIDTYQLILIDDTVILSVDVAVLD